MLIRFQRYRGRLAQPSHLPRIHFPDRHTDYGVGSVGAVYKWSDLPMPVLPTRPIQAEVGLEQKGTFWYRLRGKSQVRHPS